jgi:chitinase
MDGAEIGRLMKKREVRSRASRNLIETLESRVMLSASTVHVVGYFPDYEWGAFSHINLSGLTNINYFDLTANNNGSLGEQYINLSHLSTLVTAAHADGVKVSITVGPQSFSTLAQNPTALATFVSNMIQFCTSNNLDGIDLDWEPTPTGADITNYGTLIGALYQQTSAHGLLLTAAVNPLNHEVPLSVIPDVNWLNVMCYDFSYADGSTYTDTINAMNGWAAYGVPQSKLVMGIPFYGRMGTSWSNTFTETYAQIMFNYYQANGTYPTPATNYATGYYYNGVTTVQQKVQYSLGNGFGGVAIWELGQDFFNSSGTYSSVSLFPAVTGVVASYTDTWTAGVSSAWSNASNWKYGVVPSSTTNVVINGGNPTVSSPLNVASITLNGGTLTVPNGDGTSTTNSLVISPGATLDLGNNALIINYGTGSDPVSTIRGYLTTGYNGGGWNGSGIMSSTAATTPGFAVAYADGADGVVAGLSSGQIEVTYAMYGDLNLDGVVNGTDFGILAANFGSAVSAWDKGDLNYDGVVNGSDFSALAQNFGRSYTLPAVTLPPTNFTAVDSLAATSTPVNNVSVASAYPPAQSSGVLDSGNRENRFLVERRHHVRR